MYTATKDVVEMHTLFLFFLIDLTLALLKININVTIGYMLVWQTPGKKGVVETYICACGNLSYQKFPKLNWL